MLYRDAGVDTDIADKVISELKEDIKGTYNKHVLRAQGFFGAAFEIPEGYKNPVLISSIDGLGTKILLAIRVGKYRNLGKDIVNHCVNDILTMGAKPLYILDYLASGKLEEQVIIEFIRGMTEACRDNDCSLIGGETAEMPGMYEAGHFDIAVQITGIVEKENIIDGSAIRDGDKVYGLKSSGFHTNGYSLIRSVLSDEIKTGGDTYIKELEGKISDIFLIPHRSYYREIYPILESIHGIIHITGGGFQGNIPRVIPNGFTCYIDTGKWEIPEPFRYIQGKGKIPVKEMFRVFNMGIGMIVIGAKPDGGIEIGEIRKGEVPLILDGI